MKKQKKKKKLFLAIYLGSAAGMKKWEKLSPKVREERHETAVQAWGEWVNRVRDSLVDPGTPLGATKRVNRKGVSNTSNAICAYTIVQADSHAAAAKLFKNHPHFAHFPGESVEIIECLAIPGME